MGKSAFGLYARVPWLASQTGSVIGPDRECHCVIDEPPDDREQWDDHDRKLVADVERHGWAVFGILADGSSPGWAFTTGLWHTFGSAEVAMFGLNVSDMQHWLNAVGEHVRGGRPPRPGEYREGVLEGFPVTFRSVHETWYNALFGFLVWFARRPPLPVMELIWPDRKGLFPWDHGCGERCRLDQPQLWLPKDLHPPGQWTTR